MGYTHYWYKTQAEIDQETWNKITIDFKRLLPEFDKLGIQLADGMGENDPVIDGEKVFFNGRHKCGHAKNEEISIPWPAENAKGIAGGFDDNQASGQWFAGALIDKRCCDGSCDYETFGFERAASQEDYRKDEPLIFNCTKTAYRPYDLAVNCFLIIAKHWLGGELIVMSDGDSWNWADGRILCQTILGYGADFEIDTEEKKNALEAREKARLKPILEEKKRVADEAERERILRDYAYLEKVEGSKKSGHALGAANIKKELARVFPGVKFTVKSDSFSGGNSIDVSWVDGPTTEEVEKITAKYSKGSFDGMTDCYNYSGNQFAAMYGGAKYVHESRKISPERYEETAREYGYKTCRDKWNTVTCETYEQTETMRRETWKKSFFAMPEKEIVKEPGPKESPAACVVGSYKGHAVITLPSGFSFGLKKAKDILANLEEIKKFIENNS